LQIPQCVGQLDEALTEYVSRPIAEIDPVELSILRLGAYELLHRPDVPYRVILNEAVELAKTFGAEDSHKFVNGILDKVALRVRATETARARS
jgi:N utilization substance protein B